MDDLIRESMEGFDDVWRRVTGRTEEGPAPSPPPCHPETPPPDPLPALMRQEACVAFQSAALARMCQGDGRAILMRHAGEAKRRLRRLRAEQFIAAGHADAGDGPCPLPDGRLAALRALYLGACSLAGAYEKASEGSSDPALAQVFTAFSEESLRRAKELRVLIVDSF